MTHRSYPQNLPSTYAAEKLQTALARRSGPLGAAIARATSVAAPGAPVEAWLGFASNGDVNEVTEVNELGAFGIEGARVPSLRVDPTVVRILSRPAGDWHDLPDQAAMGIVNVLDHAKDIFASLPAVVRPSSPSSPWNLAVGIYSWSLPANARRGLERHPELAAVPEATRWNALYRAIAEDAAAGIIPLANDHSSEAYTALRTNQKIQVTRALGSPFFGPSDPASDEVLARAVVGLQIPPGILATKPMVLAESGIPVLHVVAFGVAGVALVELWRRRRRLWS